MTESEIEETIESALVRANDFLSTVNEENIDISFQAMIIAMIDGLRQLGAPDDLILKNIENHLNGNTSFFIRENSKENLH